MKYIFKCPKCGSDKIDQYRMLTGPIWCSNCNYMVDHKEVHNPFIKKIKEEKDNA